MAPELVREQPYNQTADLWSLGVILYELFVGQPPFYTNSVYALIRHIIKDPVKYPDNMSSNFRSFLQGLLHKIPSSRLTWPALLEHPFVKESLAQKDESYASTTISPGGCNAQPKQEKIPKKYEGHKNAIPESKLLSALESCRACPEKNQAKEEFPGFPSQRGDGLSGSQMLEQLENNSCTAKGAKMIGQDSKALAAVLLPLKKFAGGFQSSCRDQDVATLNQSIRILSNLISAGAFDSRGTLDELISELLNFASSLAQAKLSGVSDLMAKSFSVVKKLLDHYRGTLGYPAQGHWITLAKLLSKVVHCNDDNSGRVLNECTACVGVMLYIVANSIRASAVETNTETDASPKLVDKSALQILDHVKSSGVLDCLCLCLELSGSYLLSGSTSLLRAACEACSGIWSLMEAYEILSGRASALLPINSFLNASVPRADSNAHHWVGMDSDEVTDFITKAFLKSKAIQVAIYSCLHQRHEVGLNAGLQLILRCCMHNDVIASILCGLPSKLPVTTVVSGGGDGTVVSEIFSILSVCAVSSKDNTDSGTDNMKLKVMDTRFLVMNSCLVLAMVAHCLKLSGRPSALFMLTNSSKKQFARLSVLAHHFSSDERMQFSMQASSAASMLALASILSLVKGISVDNAIFEMALPLIPRTATLCDHLRDPTVVETIVSSSLLKGMLPSRHGIRDGSVGVLDARLNCGGPLAVQQLCASGVPQLLIDLFSNNISNSSRLSASSHDQIGLSPPGIVWTVSCICQCLSGGISTFRLILLRKENIKCITDLISVVHLKLVKSWTGPGGGKYGVKEIINSVIDLLAFPFVAIQSAPDLPSANASVNSGFLLNMGSPGAKVCSEDKVMLKTIHSNMKKYIQILLEIEVPAIILHCLDHLDSKDIARPVAFMAKLSSQLPLAVQLVEKGLLDKIRVKKFPNSHSPKEVMLDFLMIVSDLARMDKVFYEHIDAAEILEDLKHFLMHEDPNIRAKACSAIGNMCRHSSYFYTSLAKYEIISVIIDRCGDSDKRTKKFACFAVGNAAYHNDSLYDELKRVIPELRNVLLSDVEDKTKANAAGALSNLVRNSGRLCQDIVSHGAMQALLKVVAECSRVALSPLKAASAGNNINESPLKIALFSLVKMCQNSLCRQFIRTSELLPHVAQLRQSPESTIANYAALIVNKVAQT